MSWKQAEDLLGCSRDTVKRRAIERVKQLFGNPRGGVDTYLRIMLEGEGVEFQIGGRWVRLRKPTKRYAVWLGET